MAGFPIAVVGEMGLAIFDKIQKGADVAKKVAEADNVLYMQTYHSKRLALELAKVYTTGTKDVNGSVIPQVNTGDRNEQIDRLIQATLNQGKFR